jgi:hypothetical protein
VKSSSKCTASQRIKDSDPIDLLILLPITVNHEGNTQSSEEEVVKIQQLIDELKTGTFTNNEGIVSSINDSNILVIAPYNM